jgi:hypothetical protein
LKGYAFKVDEGKSVAIECKIIYEEKYRPPFWEWINEDDEKNILTIREDRSVVFPGFLPHKTDRHDITEVLLKMVLNTITLTLTPMSFIY